VTDFSANARVYDSRHGALLSDDLAQRLIAAADLPLEALVLDVGAGTGRVAIPLASFGRRIVAVDRSVAMLQQLREKLSTQPIPVAIADGGALPFRAASFDAVVVARLLYLLPEWRRTLDEGVRVLRDGGRLLHEWGNGDPDEEWVQIRDQARRLFEAAGVANPFHAGVREEQDVDRALVARGMTPCAGIRAESDMRTTLGQFLDRIDSGECSYIWNVPPDVQRTCLPQLREWAAERFDLAREVTVPRALEWTLYRKP